MKVHFAILQQSSKYQNFNFIFYNIFFKVITGDRNEANRKPNTPLELSNKIGEKLMMLGPGPNPMKKILSSK